MGVKIHCKICPAHCDRTKKGGDFGEDENSLECRLNAPVSIPRGDYLHAYFPSVNPDDWCMAAPGQEILLDEQAPADQPLKDEGFPRPVWDAAKEIEAKRAYPNQPTLDQIMETGAIIWAKVEPLIDAVISKIAVLEPMDMAKIYNKDERKQFVIRPILEEWIPRHDAQQG